MVICMTNESYETPEVRQFIETSIPRCAGDNQIKIGHNCPHACCGHK